MRNSYGTEVDNLIKLECPIAVQNDTQGNPRNFHATYYDKVEQTFYVQPLKTYTGDPAVDLVNFTRILTAMTKLFEAGYENLKDYDGLLAELNDLIS
jgi:hypothetical protein